MNPRDAVREAGLLSAEQATALDAPPLRDLGPDDFLDALVARGWLTRFQADAVRAGHAARLRLGHYVLMDRVGHGGMGEVFRARQLKLKRVVALKVIHPDCLTKPGSAERFSREAQAAARLAHPNVVRLFDSDSAGGLSFMAMEFVEGADLGRVVRTQGPMDPGRACDLILQAALGLQHAHEQGLVHRDIKPGNLLVTADAGRELVKVLDFGLARFTGDHNPAGAPLTETGTVIGTPEFLAPEQARDSRAADIRSDVFSLGCTLYYLLTARVPFAGDNIMEKLLARVNGDYTPAWMCRPDLPAGLEEVIARCLAPNPADRFQVPADLADALEPFALGRPAAVPLADAADLDDNPSTGRTSAVFDFERTDSPRPDARTPRSVTWLLVGGAATLAFFGLAIAVAVGVLTAGRTPPEPVVTAPEEPPTRPTEATAWPMPEGERAAWHPRELLGVIGSSRGRSWRPVTSLGASPDGKTLAVVSVVSDVGSGLSETHLSLWDAASLRPGQWWRVPAAVPDTPPTLSPDGRWLFLAGAPGRLFDLKVEPPRAIELPHAQSGGFPDARTLVAFQPPNFVVFRDLSADPPAEFGRLRPDAPGITSGVMSPDGRAMLLATLAVEKSGGRTGGLRLLRPERDRANEVVLMPPTANTALGPAALSADGGTAAAAVYNTADPSRVTGRLVVWPAAGGESTTLAETLPAGQSPVALSPAGDLLLARIGPDVRLYHRRGPAWKESPERLPTPPAGRLPVAFGPDAMYRGVEAGVEARAWNEGRTRLLAGPAEYAVAGVAWSADGGRLLVLWRGLAGRGRLTMHAASTGAEVGPAAEGTWHADRLTASADGKMLLAHGDGPEDIGRPAAFDAALLPRPLPADLPRCTGAAAGDGGWPLALLDARGTVSVWTGPTAEPMRFKPEGGTFALAASGDGRLLLTGGAERVQTIGPPGRETRWADPRSPGVLHLWAVDAGKATERARFRGVTSPVACVGLTANGSAAASGGRDGGVHVWDAGTGQERTGLAIRHDGGVQALAFSADGQFLASAGGDGRVVVTAADTLREVTEWRLPGPAVGLSFAPDGRRLAVAGANGTALILGLPGG